MGRWVYEIEVVEDWSMQACMSFYTLYSLLHLCRIQYLSQDTRGLILFMCLSFVCIVQAMLRSMNVSVTP
jgi:hypothetical protein